MKSLHLNGWREGLAIAFLGAALAALNAGTAAAESGCTEYDGFKSCSLVVGTDSISIPAGKYLTLVNSTGNYLQINQVSGTGSGGTGWGEYCVSRNTFVGNPPRQTSPGVGEVGCSAKNSGTAFPPVRWDSAGQPGTGLSVAPNDVLYISYNTNYDSYFNVTVYAASQTAGVWSWRQPTSDAVLACDNTTQSTAASPWTNQTGQTLTLHGAYVFAESAKGDHTTVDSACVYVLNSDGSVADSRCNVRSRGPVDFSPNMTVQPNQKVFGQASNSCPSGSGWDWAAYVYTSP